MDQTVQEQDEIDLVDYVARLDEQERLAKEEMPFDTSRCSFKRLNQSIYSCRTCFKATGQLKGVCYACSISCHTSHELVDLGFRRAFKCDCGGTNACSLQEGVGGSCTAEEDDEDRNNYEKEDNFASRFCYCLQLHDPDNEDRVMIQCLLCLDWFHDSCITIGDSTTLPKEEAFEDFFCLDCSQSISLLNSYLDIKFTNINDPTLTCCQRPNEKKRKFSVQEGQEEKNANDSLRFRGTFLPLGWRSKLCRCSDCHGIMKEGGIDYLLEKEAQYTPPIDPTLGQSSTEIAMKALGRMDRIVALDSVSKFNSLKTSLSEFLSEFAKDGRVVGSTDIITFFETLAAAARNDLE